MCRRCGLYHSKQICAFQQAAMSSEADDNEQVGSCGAAVDSVENVVEVEQIVCSSIHEFTGHLNLCSGKVNDVACSVLRDTGATICGVRKRLVQDHQYTGETVRCRLFGGALDEYPVARVSVESDFLSGDIACCVLDAPVADLIIGNIPQLSTDVLSGDCSDSSAGVVTRSQIRSAPQSKPLREVPDILNVTPDILVHKQQQDTSLTKCFQLAKSGEVKTAGKTTSLYKISGGILFRVYTKGTRSWEQVVVPKDLRPYVLTVAHDILLAGHCGARRTLARLREKFDWPGVTVDVGKYVASCDICQKTAQKGRVPPVPLVSVPVFGSPFQRVAIDFVGPIKPTSSEGHSHILTLIDLTTRYPEAIPMKCTDAKSTAEALFGVFSKFGFPKEVLSDQGSQFNSELMRQFHALCGASPIRTSPYHPQSNGVVERFHGTMKSMLRKVVEDKPREWHRFLPALLFACRELPSETTGFSPFELLFGRSVRGPVSLLQEVWTDDSGDDEDAKSVYAYIFELKNIMSEMIQVAMENTKKANVKNKVLFDRKARNRSFSKGDSVLVLLPSSTNKLLAEWKGPFPVVEVMHPDYKIRIKGKEKVLHANMLKKYVHRSAASCVSFCSEDLVEGTRLVVGDLSPSGWTDVGPREVVSAYRPRVRGVQRSHRHDEGGLQCLEGLAGVGVIDDSDDSTEVPTLEVPMSTSTPDEGLKDVRMNKDLSTRQSEEIVSVFRDFEEILTTKPGCFVDNFFLRIPLSSDVPVKRKMYQIPYASQEIVEREVETMLELGVIERSCSPYSAPVVLVKKKDGSCRFCIDFRWLNRITITDAEPIPEVDMLFAALADAVFFSRLDLAKGYWQIPILPEDRHKTAFATHIGLFQFVRMPFGLVSAPAVFARMMRHLYLERFSAVNFFDDVLAHSHTWREHLHHLRSLLQCIRDKGLTVRPSKIETGFQSLEFLGHVVGKGQLMPEEGKLHKIMQIPTPTTRKQVRAVLGLLSFYRRYVPNFAAISAPLTDLTKEGAGKSKTVVWTPVCAHALSRIQEILSSQPVLVLPRLSKQFFLRTDASSTGLGAVLMQEGEEDGLLHPVRCDSRKLLDRETRYSTIERECLAIVWAVRKFVKFLWGVHFVVQTDHCPLSYMRSSSFKNARILRWTLSLQEFSFDIQPISGTSNVLADLLSRAEMDQSVP